MTLTSEHIELLKKPFAIEDHEHRKGGADGLLTYLTEEPLIDRLNEVDPSWGFRIVNTHISDYRGEQPDTVTVHGELTLCGITRANFGVSVADIKRSEWIDGKRVTLDTPEISPLGEKDIKGAATDALKRCARMFGVGGYLLRLKDVKIGNEADFAKWYRQQFAAPHDPETGEVTRDPAPRLTDAPDKTTPEWLKQPEDEIKSCLNMLAELAKDTWPDLQPAHRRNRMAKAHGIGPVRSWAEYKLQMVNAYGGSFDDAKTQIKTYEPQSEAQSAPAGEA